MRLRLLTSAAFITAILMASGCAGEGAWSPPKHHKWAVHDKNRPHPPVVTPSDRPGGPPSDALVLFDGTDLSQWVGDNGGPARWKVENGYMEVVKGTGSIQTKKGFGSCQLHLEWATPAVVKGKGQGRGNSGVYLMSKYEVQILDSYQNQTYADGQAAAVYGQNPPMVNACRGPGQWQTYDIIFHRPIFKGDKVVKPATITVLHNGVLVQDNWVLEGPAVHKARAKYSPHPDRLPLFLQNHGCPVRFRNIWIRELPDQ